MVGLVGSSPIVPTKLHDNTGSSIRFRVLYEVGNQIRPEGRIFFVRSGWSGVSVVSLVCVNLVLRAACVSSWESVGKL